MADDEASKQRPGTGGPLFGDQAVVLVSSGLEAAIFMGLEMQELMLSHPDQWVSARPRWPHFMH